MKNKNVIWYAGFGVPVALILLLLLTDFPKTVDTGVSLFAVSILSVSYVQLLFNKMMKDHEFFKPAVMDERNIAIKEKAGYVAHMFTLLLVGCATTLFIALDYLIPAIVTGVIVAVNPIVLIIISSFIEKKM